MLVLVLLLLLLLLLLCSEVRLFGHEAFSLSEAASARKAKFFRAVRGLKDSKALGFRGWGFRVEGLGVRVAEPEGCYSTARRLFLPESTQ